MLRQNKKFCGRKTVFDETLSNVNKVLLAASLFIKLLPQWMDLQFDVIPFLILSSHLFRFGTGTRSKPAYEAELVSLSNLKPLMR